MRTTSSDRPALPIVYGGPEALFRVGELALDQGVVRGPMTTGPWLATGDGKACAGSLGVLVDNVLGYAIIAHRPTDYWSVSTEITLDLLGPVPLDGSLIRAEAEVVHADSVGGFATGRVLNDRGELVATCTERGRFIPGRGAGLEARAVDPVDESLDDVATLIGLSADTSSEQPHPSLAVSAWLENPLSNLHGGISLCASDVVGSAALQQAGHRLVTASIHVKYIRPVPTGSVFSLADRVLHRGRSLGVVEVIGSVAGKPCVISTITAHAA